MSIPGRRYTGPSAQVTKHRRVGGHGGRDAAYGGSLGETASSEDLGGSSKWW